MSDLNFQNFGLDDSPFTNPNTDRRNPSTVKDTSNLVTGNIDLNSDDTTTDSKIPNAHNFFSFKYYQQFFDVDQEMVYNRLLRSVIPTPKSNFILDHVQPLPDLYGPLWICITFVFSTAICGNLAHYIETHGNEEARYENDFGLVTGATTLITSYVIFVPFFLYWALWYRKASIQYSYLELLSAYGYSLAIFVPVSVLWVIHFHWFRWILILAVIGIGGLMLYNIVWPAVKDDPNRAVAFAIVGGVLFLHASLALGFKSYYFDSVIPSQHGIIAVTEAPPVAPEAAASIADNKNDSVKKITTRDIGDKETEAPQPVIVTSSKDEKNESSKLEGKVTDLPVIADDKETNDTVKKDKQAPQPNVVDEKSADKVKDPVLADDKEPNGTVEKDKVVTGVPPAVLNAEEKNINVTN